ncbi:envelope glycoprotein J [Macacine alphaherpesvirus 1]|nr:envelope glycoprotein J [Macacine alphaherpesvirus 1]
MRSLLFVVGAWVAAAVTYLSPNAALATDTTPTVAAANSTTANSTAATVAGTAAPTTGAPATNSTVAPETPGPFPPVDFALPAVIGGLCALTLAAMGAGALLHRCCRRAAARRRQRAAYVYA